MRHSLILKKKKAHESGQSTLEFTLTLLLVLAFFFFFFQLAVTFAFGSYVKYAVYMASRAYAAASVSEADQLDRAERIAAEMLGGTRYQRFGKGEPIAGSGSNVEGFQVGKIDPYQANRANGWLEGARYHFRSKIFPINLVPGSSNVESTVLLKAESFLGREPTTVECESRLKNDFAGKARHYDNGC